MWWSRGASISCITLILLAVGCTEEVSTVVRVELMFPEGADGAESPLDGVESLRVRIVPEDGSDELREEIDRPSAGWTELDEGLALGQVAIESAVIVIEGLDGDGDILSAGETIAVPVTSGASGRVTAFVQRLGSSGLAPSLPAAMTEHGAAYLDGGGVLLAGGPRTAPSSEAWVYAIDVYEGIQVATMATARSLAQLVPLGGDSALIVGGTQADSSPLVFDPTTNDWSDVSRSELAAGAWPSPIVDVLPGGDGALALRDRAVLRFEAEPAGVTLLDGELSRDVAGDAATLTALVGSGIAVLLDETGALAFDHSGDEVEEVELDPPPQGGRSGHAAAALSDGRLVLAGGATGEGALIEDVEVYDRGEGGWTVHEGLLAGQGRRGARLTRFLDDDRLLLSGGETEGGLAPDAVVLDLSGEGASAVAIPLREPRLHHTATALPTGTIMLAGGEDEAGEPLSVVEIVRPPEP